MKIPETSYIQRYTSIPFPDYRYIPKLTPIPSKNHLPEFRETISKFDSQNWMKFDNYLYAIDLFNHQYYWEVHEVLEKIWLKSGKKSPEGIFLQGLIQLSVALLKKIQNKPVGVKLLMEKALPKLLTQNGLYMGINVEKLLKELELCVDKELLNPPIIVLKCGQ